ncbi:MAG TPA: ABC transporter permease [Chloroflexota bacterium]|nr:ABC transporter permease [Chloroflexota bacterium]
MQRYLIGRVGQALGVLFVVSIVTFVLIHSAPGGPAILLQGDLTQEQIRERMADLGLNDPLPVQYARWLGNLLQGQLGRSLSQGVPVGTLIAERLPATLLLSGAALLLTLAIGLPLGILSAVKRNGLVDVLVTGFAFFGMSVPVFWLGILLILLFSVQLGMLPSAGMYSLDQPFSLGDRLRYLVMPTVVLATANMAQITRYTSSSVLAVLAEDYVRTAHAKGLAGRVVLTRHALRAALIPVITIVGVMLPRLVTGAAITEAIFAWPGMGRLAVDAAVQRDYPLVMGITLIVSAVVIASNLVVDMVYGWADPRIRVAD